MSPHEKSLMAVGRSRNAGFRTRVLARTLASHHDREAVVEGERSVTFGELDDLASCVCAAIIERVEGANRPIGVFIPKSIDAVGRVPRNPPGRELLRPFDTGSPQPRLEKILATLEPAAIVTTRKLAQRVAELELGGACPRGRGGAG